jgi:mRNA interferase HigB
VYFFDVRVIANKTLKVFWTIHGDVEQQLKAWYREAEVAVWKTPQDVKSDYPSASILGDNWVVFNIKGNHYRLVVKINYAFSFVWIRFIGTHAAYDRIDANTI